MSVRTDMRYAVVPTKGERPSLAGCLSAIAPQVDAIILVHNCPMADVRQWLPPDLGRPVMFLDHSPNEPYNLSRAWNAGIDAAGGLARTHGRSANYSVAVLNDDAIAPAGWYDAVIERMKTTGAVAGCSGAPGDTEVLHRKSGPVGPFATMRGWAFILSDPPLRADESMAYWYADNDLAWRAADAGGMLMIPGFQVANLHMNGYVTPERQTQIARDREAFVNKWGVAPW